MLPTDRLSSFFFVLLAFTSASFLTWGYGYIGGHQVTVFVLASCFAIFMAFNIGGNDVANSFGTSVGAGTLTIRQALLVAAVFEVSGAMLAGGAVTDTIRKGIVDLAPLSARADFDVMDFVYIMMSALLAAAMWLLIATRKGWPVSTTHSIIGGIVGASITLAGLALGGNGALALVNWGQIGLIVASWIISPLLGGLAAWLIYSLIKRLVLNPNVAVSSELLALTEQIETQQAAGQGNQNTAQLDELVARRSTLNPHRANLRFAPLIAALGSVVIVLMLLFKGLKKLDINLTTTETFLIIAMIAALIWVSVYALARKLRHRSLDDSTFVLFSWMQVFTAAGFAFSQGSNDIANAIGPFAAILDVVSTGQVSSQAPVPLPAMFTMGIAMVAGLWFIGREVIQTVGTEITRMHPSSGFAAELAAAAVVLLASTLGIPVSSTHILVGAVLGIGVVNRATNWQLMKPIGAAWVITLPCAALLAAATLVVLRGVF